MKETRTWCSMDINSLWKLSRETFKYAISIAIDISVLLVIAAFCAWMVLSKISRMHSLRSLSGDRSGQMLYVNCHNFRKIDYETYRFDETIIFLLGHSFVISVREDYKIMKRRNTEISRCINKWQRNRLEIQTMSRIKFQYHYRSTTNLHNALFTSWIEMFMQFARSLKSTILSQQLVTWLIAQF